MKKILNFILLISCFASVELRAQQTRLPAPRVLKVASSKLGNYIYLAGREEIAGKDTAILLATDHFIIKRMPFAPLTDSAKVKTVLKNLKTIGTAEKATSDKDLAQLFGDTELGDIKKYLGKKTNKELLDYVASHVKASDYGLLYSVTETRMMLGQVYLDKDVKENEVMYYQVIRVAKDKSEHPWGIAITQSKIGNYALQYLKPKVSSVQSTDSSVDISWKLRISDVDVSKFPKPKNRAAFDPDGNLLTVPYPFAALVGRVVPTRGGKPVTGLRLMPVLNATGDTLTYNYSAKIGKDEQFTAYMMAEDEIYNQGAHSDTAMTFGVGAKNIPLIFGIKVTEIVNGIHLSWDKLPAKPYLTGVEIVRYDSQDKLDTIAILAAADTAYTDYAIKVGQHYRYQVKALFLPKTGIEQIVAAQGIGAYTVFSKPLPAYDLVGTAQGNNISLTWQAANDPALYGYYVYRGTSPKRMELIAGPVKVKMFTDTAESLSGRSQYYYAVKSKNLRQDTSLYSNVVMVRPVKKIAIDPPADVLFYYANGVLKLQWADVRTRDNAIETFLVQKKKKGDANYTTFKVRSPNDAFYADSMIQKGITYQYCVASVASTGEISAYSAASEFSLEKEKVETVGLFYARSITAGIEVSVPEVIYPNRKAYNIYRRKATGGDFTKAGTMDASTFIFTDSKVEPGTVYVYTVSIIETDGREGAFGSSLSVRSNGTGK